MLKQVQFPQQRKVIKPCNGIALLPTVFADTFNNKVHFCSREASWQRNMWDFMIGQTKGLLARVTIKVHMHIVMLVGGAIFYT